MFTALNRVREALTNDPTNQILKEEYEATKDQIRIKMAERAAQREQNNSNNHFTLSERVNSYFFRKAKKSMSTRIIQTLRIQDHDGSFVTISKDDIPQFLHQHYRDRLMPNPAAGGMTIQAFLGQELMQTLPQVDQNLHQRLVAPITYIEVENIVKTMKTTSTPGPLGITNNLLKEIIKFSSSLFASMGNEVLFGDKQPDKYFFHRKIVLIRKPRKDPQHPSSYRGISLLENSFKIFSAILAKRLSGAIESVQSPHQYGFTQNRSINDATRVAMDTLQDAHRNMTPIIMLSTDFSSAFDSITFQHIKNVMEIFNFPRDIILATMKMVTGTYTIDVNGQNSEDENLRAGSGQGDPKSAGLFNLSVAPLNHLLATHPAILHNASPVFFADDDLLPLNGSNIEAIIDLIEKVKQFENVAGLKLNIQKCEFLANNVPVDEVRRLVEMTGMRHVSSLRHLGITINRKGEMPNELNIDPIELKLAQIKERVSSIHSTPIGKSIYTKFLLSSTMVHIIAQMSDHSRLENIENMVVKSVWTRSHLSTTAVTHRTHIARKRLAQPKKKGGLKVLLPQNQFQSSRFTWLRKLFSKPDLPWFRRLERILESVRRPNMETHWQLGANEWNQTYNDLKEVNPFWASIFQTGAEIQWLFHRQNTDQITFPITGNHLMSSQNIDSLTLTNRVVQEFYTAGLRTVYQLFKTERGKVTPVNKEFDQIEEEFNIALPELFRNRITRLITLSRPNRRIAIKTDNCLIQFMKKSKNNQLFTSLRLKDIRTTQHLGEAPRSYTSYLTDGILNFPTRIFERNLEQLYKFNLSPGIRWISVQVFLRTLWTRVKQNKADPNVPDLCTLCDQNPEHTIHLMWTCPMAQLTWSKLQEIINASLVDIDSAPIVLTQDMVIFHVIGTFNGNSFVQHDHHQMIAALFMVIKQIIYRHRFSEARRFTAKLAIIQMVLVMPTVINGSETAEQQFFYENIKRRAMESIGML